MKIDEVISFLRSCQTPVTIMEVCGSHTASILKNGIRQLVSPSIRLVSGPGCPVCVTTASYIDALIELALLKNHTVLSFGDMFKVKGSTLSLAEAKSRGADISLMLFPLEAIHLAQDNPQQTFIIAAVGFETSSPVYALLADQIVQKGIKNIKLLTALKTMPSILELVCQTESIDAFLCPGHVCAITGTKPFEHLACIHQKPFVVAGFEAEHILAALYEIVVQIKENRHTLTNLYRSVVREAPQPKANRLINQYFESGSAYWRGIGEVENSGLYLRREYEFLDAGSKNLRAEDFPANCRCADVIMGRISPQACPLFAKQCTPESAVGPCMVSAEGACGNAINS
ncbi:MAG: hydrogenase formation protein HypD [Oscillospiraceae bacterium]|jgi:hydrogenase expression/formation protein HypD|nr:hydrogenase formation protein HypD [Oscillospiraceae bacterium]